MRIGIDIDNVISNFDDTLLKEYLEHDKELRNTGIINENPEYLRRGMFDWSEDEEKNFYNTNIESFAKKLKVIEDAPYYIQKLKKEGHEIYIISGNPLTISSDCSMLQFTRARPGAVQFGWKPPAYWKGSNPYEKVCYCNSRPGHGPEPGRLR